MIRGSLFTVGALFALGGLICITGGLVRRISGEGSVNTTSVVGWGGMAAAFGVALILAGVFA